MSSESESVSPCLNIEKCSLVLVDVAGTTTSINFVKDTLFPFVAAQAEAFLKAKWEEEPIKECINLIKDGDDLDLSSAVEKVKTLTTQESDNKGLKTLQGLIYKEGYEKGDLKAHIFDDVVEAFESWAKNRRVAVYSTGSVDSQKLLFSHTVHGDVTAHIHKYFDQEVGLKTESDSYKAIAKDVEITPEEIVFITDDFKEATAAKNGGLTAVLIKREGNAELPEEAAKEFMVVSSFKELGLEKVAKRKNDEEVAAEEAPPAKIPKTDTEETEKPPQTEEKTEQTESMEVDTEKKPEETETPVEMETTAETETSVAPEPAKTENKEESSKSEVKEEKATDEKMETVESETTEKAQEEAKVEEEKVVEEKAPQEAKEEDTKSEEVKPAEEPKVEETPKEETTSKVEEKKEVVETPKEQATTQVEETKEEKTKVEEPAKEDVTTQVEETKVVEETKTEEENKAIENGDEKPETKTEEKENKSVLANGVENGKDEVEKVGESSEVQIDVDQSDETEVKVKKLEESAESKTVSVEV